MSHMGENGWVRVTVDRYEKPLTLYATRLVNDPDRARDIVQDVFLKLCEQPRAKVEHHLAEWLFTVCRNRALDVLRKEGRMSRLSEIQERDCPDQGAAPAEILERREEASQVLRMLETLPPNQREVIRLKFQNGFSYKEISRISGHSVTNVGFLIHTGLKTIRTQLGVHPSRPAPAQS